MSTYLVTGAAGFIGSNLVEALLSRGDRVIGFDNYATGKRDNLSFTSKAGNGQFTMVEGDIRDTASIGAACRGVDFILHQAALGSVPRSVAEPALYQDVNSTGTLNVLLAAREARVKRVVYAASSSAYGDSPTLPKHEAMKPDPLSPYAVTKLTGEYNCRVFTTVYGVPAISLRYFNVFGRRQDPHSQYAAVIPAFANALLRKERPTINGDGEQSRDFTYVDNVVQANLRACAAPADACGLVYNIACGGRITINRLFAVLAELLDVRDVKPIYAPGRAGDVKHSLADITLARTRLGYDPQVDAESGLVKAAGWYREFLTSR